MRSDKTLKRKTYVLLFLMVLLGSVGNTILDKGMKDIGVIRLSSLGMAAVGFAHIVANLAVWTGIGCMLCFFVCHMLVLSWADYSFVMPFSALTYALVPLLGYLFLHEHVVAARWIGIVLIFFGVVLINRTPPRTTAQH